jgi:hypothetical protein
MQRFSDNDIATIRQMVADGHSGVSIAHALGRTAQAIRVKATELGIALRTDRPVNGVTFRLPDNIFTRLQAEARKRGLKVRSLARLILSVVCNRNLFSAVLDPPPVIAPTDTPKPRPMHRVEVRVEIPDAVLRERDARLAAQSERDLTASIFGDPPPRRLHSLGACAAGDQIYAMHACTLTQVYLTAHVQPRPSFVVARQ